MNLKMETVITVISAYFVIFTALIDPKASFSVAVVAILLILSYLMIFSKKDMGVTSQKKVATIKTKKVQSKRKTKK